MELIKQDYELLSLLNHCRYITTKQIVRLYFPDNTLKTATRRANLFTKKLSNLGLIAHLERRIGGIRAGSGSKGLRCCMRLNQTSNFVSKINMNRHNII